MAWTDDAGRWWRTLRPVPPAQHGHRAWNAVRKRAWQPLLPALVATWHLRGRDAVRHLDETRLRALGDRLQQAPTPPLEGLDHGTLQLAGQTVAFPPPDWRLPDLPPLAVYEAHAFDWADALAGAVAAGRTDLLALLAYAVQTWTQAVPHLPKAWEPYPRARRTLACLRAAARLETMAWHAGEPWTDAHLRLRDALLTTAGAASCDLGLLAERHLGANHLLVDRVAQAAAALAWQRDAGAVDQALAEAEAQFPGDGAHVEAAPMYHALLCDDLLTLRGLLPDAHAARLDALLERTLGWLAAVRHPDGRLPAFGDTDPDVLDRLPVVRTALVTAPRGTTDPQASVWTSRWGGHFAVVHTAPPAHAPQPGHAHADHLAVEWSRDDVRILADAGLAGYEGDVHRALNRSAASHSTVEVPDLPSIELWASFRVGRRGRVLAIAHGQADGWHWLTAAHAWPDDTLRHLRLVAHHTQGRLLVVDALQTRGPQRHGVGRLHLAPGVTVAAAVLQAGRVQLPMVSTSDLHVSPGLRFQARQPIAGQHLRYAVAAEPVWTLLGSTDLASARAALAHPWSSLAASASAR